MGTGKDRQRMLAREHHERQMKRRAERAAKARRNAVIGSTVGVVAVVGGVVAAFALIGGQNSDTSAQASPDPSQSAPAEAEPTAYDKKTGTCGYAARTEGATKSVGLPPGTVSAKPKTMTVKTGLGTIEAELAGDKAPCTVGSFEFLASKKYFDNTVCHRVTTKGIKVLQCGDAQAKGDGKNPTDGQGNPGYRFVDENLQGAEYVRGVLAMANSGPNTNGSQFFIVYGDETKSLPPNFTPFGTVTKGMEIVDKVAKAGVESPEGDGPPKERVELKSVTISGKD
ncbi:peptidylprolyl isomerase [Sinosporangium siamense]|uniref:Peptidyl-prolyl cis-trans isomerase n=1 Tax=Sinosporangium siamense TaxID=1367973 RepID=A0A919RN96_9ACTN|nr:peptidylprolyl isomerase [Sinosporangium siamense]GII95321.1 peptidyl-prolyl cis-trans isomerase [Sinosporangium siamense]